MSNIIFEAGDVVRCFVFGDKEFVLEKSNISKYPIQISFLDEHGMGRLYTFTQDGKSSVHHTHPVLKLVRKKIKKRVIIEFFKVYSENESFFLENNEFGSYDDAFDWIKRNGINGWVYSIDKFYKIKDL